MKKWKKQKNMSDKYQKREEAKELTRSQIKTYQNLSKPNNTCEVDLISKADAIEVLCKSCRHDDIDADKEDRNRNGTI